MDNELNWKVQQCSNCAHSLVSIQCITKQHSPPVCYTAYTACDIFPRHACISTTVEAWINACGVFM